MTRSRSAPYASVIGPLSMCSRARFRRVCTSVRKSLIPCAYPGSGATTSAGRRLYGVSASWTPSSWRARPAGQQPEWPDEGRLDDVLKRLAALPPLVFAGEARRLTAALGDVAQGRAFLPQAGDCAESFDGFPADPLRDHPKVHPQ